MQGYTDTDKQVINTALQVLLNLGKMEYTSELQQLTQKVSDMGLWNDQMSYELMLAVYTDLYTIDLFQKGDIVSPSWGLEFNKAMGIGWEVTVICRASADVIVVNPGKTTEASTIPAWDLVLLSRPAVVTF